jgi:hypothetical protein
MRLIACRVGRAEGHGVGRLVDCALGKDGGGFGKGDQLAQAEEDVLVAGQAVDARPLQDDGQGAQGQGRVVAAAVVVGARQRVQFGRPVVVIGALVFK